jgi:WD40 repeat protein
MDWTTPLKSQQVDFINRLNYDPATLLHCPIPGRHSEVVTIAGSQLKRIRAFCRQSLVGSEIPSSLPSMPVRQMLLKQLPLELAIEAIATVLSNRVTKIHSQERQATNRSLNLSVKNISGETQAIFGIQVKVTQGMSQAVQWRISREEINQNILVICLLLPNPIEESQTEYAPILAGFLPTHLIECSDPSVDLKLSDLLYIGGLTSYLDSLKLESRDSQWLRPIISGSSYVYPLGISGDGQTVVSSSYDGTIKIWHLSDRQLLDCLGGHTWSSYPITGSSGGQNFPGNRSDQNMGDYQKGLGTLIHSLPGHSSGVSALAISPNGKILASGGYDGMISIWNLENGQQLRKFPGHSSTVKPMIISPDGNLLATGSTDKHLKLWHLDSSELVRSFPLSDPPISIAISPNGQMLVSGSTEGLLQIWQISTGETKYQLTGHAGLVRSLAISDDGQTLASSSTEKTIKLWNLETGELLNTLTGHTDPMMAFTVKPDGQTLELSLSHRQESGWKKSL